MWVIDAYTTTAATRTPRTPTPTSWPRAAACDHKLQLRAQLGEGRRRRLRRDREVLHRSIPTDPIVHGLAARPSRSLFTHDQMPDELRGHFRYPEDLFRVQTNMWGRYHINDPTQFFQRDQFWSVAQEPPQTVDPGSALVTTSTPTTAITTTTTRAAAVQPLLHDARRARANTPQFSLVRPFVPFSETDERKNLIALMAVSSDPGSYGKLRVLNIKSPEQIDGPALVDSNIKRKYAADFTCRARPARRSASATSKRSRSATVDPVGAALVRASGTDADTAARLRRRWRTATTSCAPARSKVRCSSLSRTPRSTSRPWSARSRPSGPTTPAPVREHGTG